MARLVVEHLRHRRRRKESCTILVSIEMLESVEPMPGGLDDLREAFDLFDKDKSGALDVQDGDAQGNLQGVALRV